MEADWVFFLENKHQICVFLGASAELLGGRPITQLIETT